MVFRSIYIVLVIVSSLTFLFVLDSHADEEKYLVKGSSGPSAISTGEMAQILENVVIPSLNQLAKWEEQGKITGGLPVGQRSFVFILEASSSEEVDKLLRSLPIWTGMEWKVVPLQSFSGRGDMEESILSDMKKK